MPGSTVISTGVPLAIYSKVLEGNEYLQNSEPEDRGLMRRSASDCFSTTTLFGTTPKNFIRLFFSASSDK